MRCSDVPVLLLAIALAAPAAGQDASRILRLGPSYAVAEPDLLDTLARRATAGHGRHPDWPQRQREAAEEALHRPAPVAGLARTTVATRRRFDPTVTLAESGNDALGRWLPAGIRVNPLGTAVLLQPLLLFDARDARQLAFATRYLAGTPRATVVLTGGDPLALAARWQRPVYFDQHGLLTARLGLQQVPALVTQSERSLQIDELLP